MRLGKRATLSETVAAAKPPCHDGIYMKLQELECKWAAHKAARPDAGTCGIRSAKAHRFEILVGLNDLPQPIFRRAVAAIRIRVMALHQHLESQLDVGGGCPRVEPEGIERTA